MQMQIDLCIELGLPVRNMDLMDVYLTAGNILRDDVVRKKVLPMGSSKQAIQDMTDAERRDLRERVQFLTGAKR